MNLEYVQLVDIPRAKSKDWTHFGFAIDATGTVIDKKKTVCELCEVNIVYSSNTSNLTYMYHLQQLHPLRTETHIVS